MYFNAPAVHAARLAAIDHCRLASEIVLDSTGDLVDLYRRAGVAALSIATASSGSVPLPDALIEEIGGRHVPNLVAGHLGIAGRVQQGLVRLFEAQIQVSTELAHFALGKAAQMSPPLMELAANAADSLVEMGQHAAQELGETSRKAIDEAERKIQRSVRPKRKSA